jgi:hypothetical protein
MSDLCIYFGTAEPDPAWAASLRDIDVVLEPYHPVVQERRFAATFPHARRFVYVNPTTVDPWLLERSPVPPPLIGYDERWNLPRLDLDQTAGFDWAVDTAVRIAQEQGHGIDGLFVDDLDRLIPGRRDTAIDYLVQVAVRLGREPGWFVNRGFELWPFIEGLDAVLLEDITPHLVAFRVISDVRWMREVVLDQVRTARARGVRVHSLGYRDQEPEDGGRSPDRRLERELAALVDSITTGAGRSLDEWMVSG